MSDTKTKIVVIQKALPSMWYNDKIRKRFKVNALQKGDIHYELADPNTKKIIFKEDCIIL
jgi:hypothetical protein